METHQLLVRGFDERQVNIRTSPTEYDLEVEVSEAHVIMPIMACRGYEVGSACPCCFRIQWYIAARNVSTKVVWETPVILYLVRAA